MKPAEVFIVFFAGGRFIFPPAQFFGEIQASLTPFCVFPFSLFRDLLSQLPCIFRHLLLFVSSFRDFLFCATVFPQLQILNIFFLFCVVGVVCVAVVGCAVALGLVVTTCVFRYQLPLFL